MAVTTWCDPNTFSQDEIAGRFAACFCYGCVLGVWGCVGVCVERHATVLGYCAPHGWAHWEVCRTSDTSV